MYDTPAPDPRQRQHGDAPPLGDENDPLITSLPDNVPDDDEQETFTDRAGRTVTIGPDGTLTRSDPADRRSPIVTDKVNTGAPNITTVPIDHQADVDEELELAVDEERGQPRAGLPILACGSTDPMVPELFAKLAELGYDTPTSRGENPHGIVGVEELQAIRQFRRAHGVTDDPEAFGGDHDEGRKTADSHVGPWSIEAILQAHDALA